MYRIGLSSYEPARGGEFSAYDVLAHIDYPVRGLASDAHSPDRLAAGLAEAVRVAGAAGFSMGDDPLDLWRRTSPHVKGRPSSGPPAQ